MAIVYLSLGSNIGDRVGYVQQAAGLIGALSDVSIVSTSSFYETEPWQMQSDNWFVNAVMQISTSLSAESLLEEIKRIEKQLGRPNERINNTYQDRTIDIDILFYDNQTIYKDNLIIPHPYIHRRAFILVPMLEIAEDLVHPLFNKTIAQLYEDLDNPETVYLYGTRI